MSSLARAFASGFAGVLLAGTAAAQFGNAWVEFTPAPGRILTDTGAVATYATTDPQEKDFASGDLDQDGWTDLVVVRKQPVQTTGAFANWLMMNEGGLLVDRSAQYASASDVAGDNGFLTPTNDRDAKLVDVNLDGWLDLVTATTMSSGQPKHISHPRVYVNQGEDAEGAWLGLRYEEARIPTMTPTPQFENVAFGDVTGDGAPDLFFSDAGPLDDRLLVNDGNGFFTDSGTTRMSAAMLSSDFGLTAEIVDMNADGTKDVVRCVGAFIGGGAGPLVSVSYNDPANVGFFPPALYQSTLGSSLPYHMAVGDLNQDTRPDIVLTDDASDVYRYNTGVDALGRVVLGPNKTYQFLTGNDDGFGGSALIADLDGDGWNDTIHSDFDAGVFSCASRCHVYHNPGGTPGAQITLREEAESTSTAGWRGAKGLYINDLKGTFDVAAFDLDNDGDLDLVLGRCAGTFVWLNQTNDCPSESYAYGTPVANSTGFAGHLDRSGSTSIAANDLVLTGTGFPPDKTALFLYGTQRLWTPAPFGNGLRWIGGPIQRLPVFQTDGAGNAGFAADFTSFPLNLLVPSDVRDFQLWYRDPLAGGAAYNVSNALEIVVCP